MKKLLPTLIVPVLFILAISGCAAEIDGNMPQGQGYGNGAAGQARQYDRGREDYPGQNYAALVGATLPQTGRNSDTANTAAGGKSGITGTQLQAGAGAPSSGNRLILRSIKTPVRQGGTGGLSIQGRPDTQYTITAVYRNSDKMVTSTAVKRSGGDGAVELEWNVDRQTAPGTYGIMITGGGEQISASYTVIEQG